MSMKFSLSLRAKLRWMFILNDAQHRSNIVVNKYKRYRLMRALEKALVDALNDKQAERYVSDFVETNRVKQMASYADTILLFVCPTPDDAEAAVGDLMERFDQVRARKSWRVSLTYFYWELLLLTVTKAKKRLVGATIGPLLRMFFVGSS